ncbi:hypothetical protein KR018_006477 [Drosophila ironensis]|nr:hypothetical protein KR018_006477 [Drosophila ironensis]
MVTISWIVTLLLVCPLALISAQVDGDGLLGATDDSQAMQTYLTTSKLRRLAVEFFDFYQNITVEDLARDSRAASLQDLQCLADLKVLGQDLLSAKYWALKMTDSWGSLPSGILTGNLIDLGNFDECLAIDHVVSVNHSVQGKYCFTRYPLATSVSPLLALKTAVCFPASCSASNMDMVLRKLLENLLNIELEADVQLVKESSCKIAEKESLDSLTIFTIVILSLLAALVLLATLGDYFQRDQKNLNPVIKAFSARANCRTLFRIVDTKSNPNVIECLHGIRCLSFIWVVYGHDYLVYAYAPNLNYTAVHRVSYALFSCNQWYIILLFCYQWLKSAFSSLLQHSAYSVDTFFFLSGLLLVVIALRTMEKTKGKINIPLMYLHRYLRLTPILAIGILVYMKILPRMGDGPLYGKVNFDDYTKCQTTWFWTLLYVQNYATDNICLGHSWYLAVDMQLYIFAPLILIALYKWGWRGCAGLVVIMLLLASCLFSIMVIKDISLLRPNDEAMKKIYFATHTRASPYIIGILFGYFLHVNRGRQFKLPPLAVILGWVVSSALLLTCIFGVYHDQRNLARTPILEEAFYLTFTRIAWPLGLCWVVFACMQGYGYVANSFLSSPLWQPLSRISYSAYIFHMFVESLNAGITRTNTNFTNYEVMLRFWSDFGFTVLLAILAYILVEAPFGNLESLLLPTNKPKRKDAPSPAPSLEKKTPIEEARPTSA